MNKEPGPITALLKSFRDGQTDALDEIFRVVLPELKRVARILLSRERDAHILQPTALVNEAFLRLFDGEPPSWNDSRHFVSSAVCEMRRTLIDYARKSEAQKRQPIAVGDNSVVFMWRSGTIDPTFLIDLDRGLAAMHEVSKRAASVAEMTVFAALTSDEIGAVLNVSGRTIDREWRWAKAWLRNYLYPRTESAHES